MAGKARLFGYGEVALAIPVDFSRDPVAGKRWPTRHAKLIDYRHSEVGDPKVIWELNRCQHVPGLIQAWLMTGEERFARAAVDVVLDWIDQQAPGRGIAWSNGFEAGLRAISFALCFDALRGSDLVGPQEKETILLSLFQHGRWITRDPSEHSSANNHLVGELAGLAAIALLAPELRTAERWERYALQGLEREAESQVLADGLGAEQAFTYTLFVSELLLLTVSLLQARKRAVPPPLLQTLSRVGVALWAQLGTTDPAPTYGDTDDAWAVRLDPGELRNPRGVAASILACTSSDEARSVAGDLVDPTALWLFGAQASQRQVAGTPQVPSSAFLESGGLVILRDRGHRATMDVGPLGYLSIAAHGHADALQVTLSDGEQELVVDPGVGSYFAHPEKRRSFRGTEFHPTVTVDRLDQSEQAGPFLWKRHARSWSIYVDLARGVAVGEHDGYARLSSPVRHRRVLIMLDGGSILVYDRLESVGEHNYRLVWPLHPSLDASPNGEVVFATRDGAPRLAMRFASSAEASSTDLRLSRGEEHPFSGWWSPRLEEIEAAWHCSLETTAHGPVDLATLLCPVNGNRWPQTTLKLGRSESETNLKVSIGRERWLITVGIDEGMPIVVSRRDVGVGSLLQPPARAPNDQ